VKPMTAPPDIKAALKKTFAIERLRKAAQALLDENTEVAVNSYAGVGSVLTDAVWKKEDPGNAKLCIELRRPLKELEALKP
jgi:hypothetical protein